MVLGWTCWQSTHTHKMMKIDQSLKEKEFVWLQLEQTLHSRDRTGLTERGTARAALLDGDSLEALLTLTCIPGWL